MDEAISQAKNLLSLLVTSRIGEETVSKDIDRAYDAVDEACLELCISLLDHNLRGDLFESAIVGFLAALGIDVGKGTLKEAYHYKPSLPSFIKIAQMLVIQKSVVAATTGEVAKPADLLDNMRSKFYYTTLDRPSAGRAGYEPLGRNIYIYIPRVYNMPWVYLLVRRWVFRLLQGHS